MTYNEYLDSNDRRKRIKLYDKISLGKKKDDLTFYEIEDKEDK